MTTVLVLGSGRVVNPFVRYLLDQTDFSLIVASLDVDAAANIIGAHPKGSVKELDARNIDELKAIVGHPDVSLVASFLPPVYDVDVAKLCIANRKPMLLTSYASDELKALSREAQERGILILAEVGLDPGIDHMSAMKTIHEVQNDGGNLTSFRSVCGAIPAPEASLNPLGYKFSWYPKGALGAARRSARYLENGEEIAIPSDSLFKHYSLQYIERLGYFESYPNMDCLPYIDTYGISTARTIYRGALRYIGWCETLKSFIQLGLLNEKERSDLGKFSYRELLAELTGTSHLDQLERNLELRFHIDKDSAVMKRIEWLGFLSDEPLSLQKGSIFDVLLAQMQKKMCYDNNERDMVVLQDEFVADYPDGRPTERITSTLIDYGDPGGDSAIARTVGLPAAIASRLILEGRVRLSGVQLPVDKAIYRPILEELETRGIVLSERRFKV